MAQQTQTSENALETPPVVVDRGGESAPLEPSTETSTQPKVIIGSKCEAQTLYEGPEKCDCCINWIEEYPEDLRMEVEEQEATKQKALIVRKGKNHGDGKALVLHSIVVQSQSLKDTLGEVFEGYSGITTSLQKLVFKAPFHQFHYRWEAFTKILERQKQENPETAEYSQLLYDVLNTELGGVMAEVKDLLQHGVMTYPLLWSIFEPGQRIYASVDGYVRFFIVDSVVYNTNEHHLIVTAKFIDWDGEEFGWASGTMKIKEYSGTRSIASLDVCPASFLPERARMEAAAMARGQKLQELQGVHYMAYSGQLRFRDGVNESGEPKRVARSSQGRIVVDAASFLRVNADDACQLLPLDAESITPQIGDEDDSHFSPGLHRHPGARRGYARSHDPRSSIHGMQRAVMMVPPGYPPMMTGNTAVEQTLVDAAPEVHTLTEDQLVLCTPHVRGYSLSLKRWAEFEVDSITDITWNDDAFPNLMLPGGFKNMILSFVEAQASNKSDFDDVIQGKGQGVIMLLTGNPGTGKTLTAEAVADRVRRPLYVLSAGELGHQPFMVEERLNAILELAEKWNAVLLFDECDVLLQKRAPMHMELNETIAVFLRLLEYYRGILLMTTNRAETMDPAFQSRIHLTLQYPDLSVTAKEHIWRQFTCRSDPQGGITDDAYEFLAALPMNGRQIKNVVKIATLLAIQEKTNLGIEHIDTVLQTTMEVDLRGV